MALKWLKQAEGVLERFDQSAKTVSGREKDAQPSVGAHVPAELTQEGKLHVHHGSASK